MPVACVILDVSKAFDSLNHVILLSKLKNIGIRGLIYDLLKGYLTDIKQSFFCNEISSDYLIIKHGVPQRSVLGPIFFHIYINDLVNVSNNVKFTLYADDTSFVVGDSNLTSLHHKLCQELININRWVTANKLKLNVDKTHLMVFQNRSIVHNLPSVNINNKVIHRVQTTKFLGTDIDDNLNWKEHICYVCLCLSKTCGILYRVRDKLTPKQCCPSTTHYVTQKLRIAFLFGVPPGFHF